MIPIPLSDPDPDVNLNLGAIFAQTYDAAPTANRSITPPLSTCPSAR